MLLLVLASDLNLWSQDRYSNNDPALRDMAKEKQIRAVPMRMNVSRMPNPGELSLSGSGQLSLQAKDLQNFSDRKLSNANPTRHKLLGDFASGIVIRANTPVNTEISFGASHNQFSLNILGQLNNPCLTGDPSSCTRHSFDPGSFNALLGQVVNIINSSGLNLFGSNNPFSGVQPSFQGSNPLFAGAGFQPQNPVLQTVLGFHPSTSNLGFTLFKTSVGFSCKPVSDLVLARAQAYNS
jgi:hypothetical protein